MPSDDAEAALARAALRPNGQAAITVREYEKSAFDGLRLDALVGELSAQAEAASGGDLKRAEAMLLAQAHTLDTIFNNLARRAARNLGQYMGATETYLRLALKAQSQCRATVETLALIKNPAPVAFVRQQNIGVNQQVNNGATPAPEPSRARETENQRTKLLERRMANSWAQERRAPAKSDSTLEAVGEVDRPTDARR